MDRLYRRPSYQSDFRIYALVLLIASGIVGLATFRPGLGTPNAGELPSVSSLAAAAFVSPRAPAQSLEPTDPAERSAPTQEAQGFEAQISDLLRPPVTVADVEAIRSIFIKWGERDPEAAFAYIEAHFSTAREDQQVSFCGAVFEGWAKSAPKDAWARVKTLPDHADSSQLVADNAWTYYDRVLTGWLRDGDRESYAAAIDLAERAASDPDSRVQSLSYFSQTYMALIAERDLDYAIGLLESAIRGGKDEVIESYTYAIASQWAKTDPAEAARWAIEIEGLEKYSPLLQIIGIWGDTAPLDALEWVNQNLASPEYAQLRSKSLQSLAFSNPVLIRPIVAEELDPDTPNYASRLAASGVDASYSNPQYALKLLDDASVRNAQVRSKAYPRAKATVIRNLAIEDPVAATAYLQSLDPEDPSDQATLSEYETTLQRRTESDLYDAMVGDWKRSDSQSYDAESKQFQATGFTNASPAANSEPDPVKQIEEVTRTWGSQAPDRVRFYLENQTVLTQQDTERLIGLLPETQPTPLAQN